MDYSQNTYCFHCMTKIENTDDELCPKCRKKHSRHFCQSNELPAGAYLENGRYLVGKSIGTGGFGITYIGFDMKLEKKNAADFHMAEEEDRGKVKKSKDDKSKQKKRKCKKAFL